MHNAERYLSDTSMKTKWLFVRRKFLQRFNPSIPRQLWIGVTYQCQCKCIHCFLGPELNKRDDCLSKQEIYKLVNSARHLGFMEICYFGGEPLLYNNLIDLIKFSSSKGLLTSIYTNGILLTKKTAKELKDAGLSFCNISIDSALSEMHNSLRGYEGCFEKALEGIRYLLDEGIRCNIWTYARKKDVQEQNLKDLKSIINLARQIKVHKVVILFPMASGNWLCAPENILEHSERNMVRTLHNPPFVELEFPTEDTSCTAGKRLVYITPQGDIHPCPALPRFFGNIRQQSLNTILKKLKSEFIDSKKKVCGECAMNFDIVRKKIDSKE